MSRRPRGGSAAAPGAQVSLEGFCSSQHGKCRRHCRKAGEGLLGKGTDRTQGPQPSLLHPELSPRGPAGSGASPRGEPVPGAMTIVTMAEQGKEQTPPPSQGDKGYLSGMEFREK